MTPREMYRRLLVTPGVREIEDRGGGVRIVELQGLRYEVDAGKAEARELV